MDLSSKLKAYIEVTQRQKESDSQEGWQKKADSQEGRNNGGYPSSSDNSLSDSGKANYRRPGFDLPGEVISNEDGSIFMMGNRYPLSYLYGGCRLGDALNIRPDCLRSLNGTGVTMESAVPCASKLLFLDIETTGLSGGTGTVAFLVGAGYFDGDSFVVRQYLMRDYDEEPAMLRELNCLFGSFDGLVTFNGRSFDWNILQGRFTFNRIKPALYDPVNLDLLFPARKVWGLKLESCSLSSLEENILGEGRIDDIPGVLIPQVYFRYLEDGCTDQLRRVVTHNELDILSMVALLVKMATMIENPQLHKPGYELYGIGRILESETNSFTHVQCFEACTETDIYTVKAAAVKRLTVIYKKSGDYEKALKHWQKMAEISGGYCLEPLVEMAKYYEHKAKDIKKAIEIVDKAIQLAVQRGMTGSRAFGDLVKRQQRLKKKSLTTRREKLDNH